MELKPLEIKITSLGDRSPGELRAQVKFQVDGGPKYVIKAIRVDVRERFINHLIASAKELPAESSGEDVDESEPPDEPRRPARPDAVLKVMPQETGGKDASTFWD